MDQTVILNPEALITVLAGGNAQQIKSAPRGVNVMDVFDLVSVDLPLFGLIAIEVEEAATARYLDTFPDGQTTVHVKGGGVSQLLFLRPPAIVCAGEIIPGVTLIDTLSYQLPHEKWSVSGEAKALPASILARVTRPRPAKNQKELPDASPDVVTPAVRSTAHPPAISQGVKMGVDATTTTAPDATKPKPKPKRSDPATKSQKAPAWRYPEGIADIDQQSRARVMVDYLRTVQAHKLTGAEALTLAALIVNTSDRGNITIRNRAELARQAGINTRTAVDTLAALVKKEAISADAIAHLIDLDEGQSIVPDPQ